MQSLPLCVFYTFLEDTESFTSVFLSKIPYFEEKKKYAVVPSPLQLDDGGLMTKPEKSCKVN